MFSKHTKKKEKNIAVPFKRADFSLSQVFPKRNGRGG